MSLLTDPVPAAGRRALVAFSGRTSLPWLRILKKGFRHCFVALDFGDRWVVIDALSHRTAVTMYEGLTADQMVAAFCADGLAVAETRTERPPTRPVPWRPHSCVQTVVCILGLRAPAVFTPWQLYRHLVNRKKNLTLA